jgi:hypothetical protein
MTWDASFGHLLHTRTRKVLAGICIAGFAFAVLLAVLAHHAGPLLRSSVVETLSARFQTRVELADLEVSVSRGLSVSGKNLLIYGQHDPNIHAPGVQPLISIDEFRFNVGVLSLLRSPIHVGTVFIKGMQLNIPPKRSGQQTVASNFPKKLSIVVDRFHVETAMLIINTDRADKQPLDFAIKNLWMKDVGPGRPLAFTAMLINPKPEGNIDSSGEFGPLNADEPRDSPVRGEYVFSHADLSTIAGIGGTLSSTGKYDGTLGRIVVDGQTDTPDFRLKISGTPVPLRTRFHAIVDGTNGNTYLQPVDATILNTALTASGEVVRSNEPRGHHIRLNVKISGGHIDDLLRLAVRTTPPVMTGNLRLATTLDIAPGSGDIADRLFLKGKFQVAGAHFSNEKIQSKVDSLSMRSQGKPKLATDNVPNNVKSRMGGDFALGNSVMTVPKLVFQMPGTRVNLAGTYSLDGNQFDFRGHARFEAKLSKMVGGWKSLFLKPVDPFFAKNGAGTELPIRITGTKSEPHFGVAFGGGGGKSQEAAAE